MPILVGDKRRFAAEVGEPLGELHRVDLWAAGHRLTCDDNAAFVPHFCMCVRATLARLRSGPNLSPPDPGLSIEEAHRRLLEVGCGSSEPFRFPSWGPTTDNVRGHLLQTGKSLSLALEFWREEHRPAEERGVVFVAEIPEAELIDVLERLIAALDCDDRP